MSAQLPLPPPLVEGGLGAVLVAGRVLPAAVFSPLFGGAALPVRLRLALGLGLAALFASAAGATASPDEWFPALGRELLLGTALAFAITLLFGAFAWVGGWIDAARGSTAAELADPTGPAPTSLLASFSLWFALALAFATGVHRAFLSAFADHLARRPVGSPLLPNTLEAAPAAALELLSDLFAAAATLAAPVLLALIAIDVCVGIVQRLSAPFETFVLGLGLRAWLGLGLFLLALSGVFAALLARFETGVGGVLAPW